MLPYRLVEDLAVVVVDMGAVEVDEGTESKDMEGVGAGEDGLKGGEEEGADSVEAVVVLEITVTDKWISTTLPPSHRCRIPDDYSAQVCGQVKREKGR